jgi:hypothetical protein
MPVKKAMHRSLHWNVLCAGISAGALLLSSAIAQDEGPPQSQNPGSGHVQIAWAGAAQMNQVSPGKGWVLMHANPGSSWENHLYWTNNNGDKWNEITPPLHGTEYINSVNFFDESHGWACVTSGAGDWDSARVAIRKGNRWLSAPLDNSYITEGFKAPFDIQFVDPLHGWMVVYSPTSPAVDPGPNQLAFTSDGGFTWKKLPAAPAAGGILFPSPKRGLLISRSTEDGKQELWTTRNGGKSWTPNSLPMPQAFQDWTPPIGSRQSMPRFQNERLGAWLVEYESPEHDRWRVVWIKYVSTDGGENWRVKQVQSYDEHHNDLFLPRFVAGSHIVQIQIESSGRPASIFPSLNRAVWRISVFKDGVKQRSSQLPPGIEGGFVLGASFADELNGWVVISTQRCTQWCGGSPGAALSGLQKHSCRFACLQFTKGVEILSTADEGRSWNVVTPAMKSGNQ